MNKRSGWVGRNRVQAMAGSVAVAVLGLLAAGGCHRQDPVPSGTVAAAAMPTVRVRVEPVVVGTHRAVEEVVGTFRAKTRSVIEAKVSGRIGAVRVFPGQAVKAGDVLVEVEAREIEARTEQARAVLQQADRELARFSTLLRQEAVTRAEYDAMESRQQVAKAALSEAETMRGYTRVVAPFAGVVSRKLADVGDLAAPGRGLLELEDPGSLRFEADVPLALSERIHLGDRFPVTAGDAGTVVDGVVGEIEPTADPVSRTFRVKLEVPADGRVRAGAFGRVGIPGAESTLPSVHGTSVTVRGQLELVHVVVEGKARLRIVRTGRRLGERVQVLSGLDVGERVVVGGSDVGSGLPVLGDGQPVEVR